MCKVRNEWNLLPTKTNSFNESLCFFIDCLNTKTIPIKKQIIREMYYI